MKQPEEAKTLELALEEAIRADASVTKRGRGRPAKEDALTPAQRAKRYRDALRAGRAEMKINRDESVTKKLNPADHWPASRISELEAEVRETTKKLEHKTRSLMSAHSELRVMTEKFEAASKAPRNNRNQVERAEMAQAIKQLEVQLKLTTAERDAAFIENAKLKADNNRDENKNVTIKELQTQCFELQQQVTLLTTTAKTEMDELKTENSSLRRRLIKTAGELNDAQQKLMADNPPIKVTEAKPSRKKAAAKAK